MIFQQPTSYNASALDLSRKGKSQAKQVQSQKDLYTSAFTEYPVADNKPVEDPVLSLINKVQMF